jgi:rhamnosyltransferase
MGGPAADNTVAVIVTFDPDREVVRYAETLVGQVVRIVVVDNGSGPAAASILDSLSALPSVEVIRNSVNLGVARALNQGAQVALDSGAGWLLTMDQDAAPGPEMVRIAGRAWEACPWPSRVAVIGSASRADLARHSDGVGQERPWIETRSVITAGSFVSLAAFGAIGKYREDFFVDYVDIEFCLRARARGYRVLASRTPTMTHRIGQPTVRSIGRRAVTPTNHSASRRYYITRNRFLVWRRYCRTDARFVAEDILASQKELLKMLLFEEDRKAKVRAILAGLRDGARSVTGERGVTTTTRQRRAPR